MARPRSAGIALQLTNILRDLKEDALRDRVYLPLEDLERCGYSIDELRRGVVSPAFCRLMELEAARAEEFYRDGSRLLGWLPPSGRRIFGMITATYHALLEKIRRRPAEVFVRRIRLGWPQKLGHRRPLDAPAAAEVGAWRKVIGPRQSGPGTTVAIPSRNLYISVEKNHNYNQFATKLEWQADAEGSIATGSPRVKYRPK